MFKHLIFMHKIYTLEEDLTLMSTTRPNSVREYYQEANYARHIVRVPFFVVSPRDCIFIYSAGREKDAWIFRIESMQFQVMTNCNIYMYYTSRNGWHFCKIVTFDCIYGPYNMQT